MLKLLLGGGIITVLLVIGVTTIFPNRSSAPENPRVFNDQSDEPPVKIKGVGLDLDKDIKFTDHKYSYRVPFEEYGNWIPAEMSATGKAYRNAQASFLVPEGTKVRALIDGFVVDVPKLYSGDYSVVVAVSLESRWRFETEHVDNPIVKPGDFVKAGQVVAEASTALGNNGWAGFEIGIGKGSQGKEDIAQHICPFAYLDDSIKEETLKRIKDLMLSWEEYRNDSNAYDENATSVPGCLVLDVLDG